MTEKELWTSLRGQLFRDFVREIIGRETSSDMGRYGYNCTCQIPSISTLKFSFKVCCYRRYNSVGMWGSGSTRNLKTKFLSPVRKSYSVSVNMQTNS